MGLLEKNTENFTVIPISNNANEKIKAYARLMPGIECYGLMLSPIGTNDGIVYDVILAKDQQVSSSHVKLDEMAVLNMKSEIESMGLKPLGFWHSHGSFDVFHSGIDDHNLQSLLPAIASYNEEKEFVNDKLQNGYFPNDDSVTVRFNGREYVFRMENNNNAFKVESQGKLYPELLYGFSKEKGFFMNNGKQTIILNEPIHFSKTENNKSTKNISGVGYSLVVNNKGDAFVQIGKTYFCNSCERLESVVNTGAVKVVIDDAIAFSDKELIFDLEKRIKNYDEISRGGSTLENSKSFTSRYHRQEKLISDWNQDKITSTKAVVIGNGKLSDLILADLLSIGVGNITRFGYSSFFEFEKINPLVNLEQVDESLSSYVHAKTVIPDADIIIDATNSINSKYYSANVALAKGIDYFSATASNFDFSIYSLPKNKTVKSIDDLILYHLEDHVNNDNTQGLLNSIICSAMTIDEVRKHIFSLKDDVIMDKYRYMNIDESNNLLNGKKILQIGAGAIGTFSALALSLMNVDLTIVDFDIIEETNLNRQFLFYDDVGINKAEALASKLKKYSSNIHFSADKIGPTFNPINYGRGYDAIFSCVDNTEARYYMNIASKIYSIPLVNAGSSLFASAAMVYVADKTACLDCQNGGALSAVSQNSSEIVFHKKRAAGECFQPSLIISNQISGSLMIDTYMKCLSGNYERTDYMSGIGIFNQKIEPTCSDYCIKHIS